MSNYPQLKMLINGEWVAQGGDGTMPVLNPATEEVLGEMPKASSEQLDAALAAADEGFRLWSAKPAIERFNILRAGAQLVRERAKDIARVVTLEVGKPMAQSLGEVASAADVIDFQAEEAKRAGGRMVPARGAHILSQQVHNIPVGPSVLLTPWNFPVNLPARKLGGALAAGCSVILKPAEDTPASAQLLVEALMDAGVPAGVINLVFGDPGKVSEHLIASPVTRKVSFTGSTAVGKHLGALAAQGMKRFTPELGGHAPVIVSENANFDAAVAACATVKYRNAGQVCVSPTRFLVARGIYDKFVAEFTDRVKQIKVGNAGEDDSVDMGPLAHSRRIPAMEHILGDLGGNRGEILTGGKAIEGNGFFFEPTVVAAPAADSRLMNEEPFGPIAGIVPFDELEDAVATANSLRYGLAAYAFTTSQDESYYLGKALNAGMVAINHLIVASPETPFGGIGDSGFGSEGGIEGYLGYTDTKFITIGKSG